MNWDSIDSRVLSHWQTLGQFRARHIAVSRGEHQKISDAPYVFGRLDKVTGDRVVVALEAFGKTVIPVEAYFSDGEELQDSYSGWRGCAKSGFVTLPATGTVLLERFVAKEKIAPVPIGEVG